MAATGYTPISLYYSTTASAVPTAGNLANGELALNTADMKLYAKNSSGVVTLLASNAATTPTTPGGSNTQVQFNNSGAFGGSANLTWNGSTFAITGAASLSGDITQSSTSGRITYSNATTSGNGGLQNNTGGSYVLLYPSTHSTKSNHTDISGTNVNFWSGSIIATVTSAGLGIGTTTPNTAGYGGGVLGIYGGSNAGGNVWLTSDATAAGNRTGRIGFGTEGNTTNKETARVWSVTAGSTAGNVGGDLLFSTKPDAGSLTERMRLDSSGNLGLGVTPSAWSATKKAFQIGNRAAYWSDSNLSTTVSNNTYVDAVGYKYLETAAATFYNQNGGVNSWWTAASGTAGAAITFTQAMTLSNAGGLSVGTTADPGAGAIYATGNITAYYSSDIKFKENVRDIPNALATVNAIGGKLFDWTDEYIESKGGADGYFVQKADFGVVAQDVQKVFPIAVRTRPDGSLAVDYEKLGALAFAALVELTKRVEALEAK